MHPYSRLSCTESSRNSPFPFSALAGVDQEGDSLQLLSCPQVSNQDNCNPCKASVINAKLLTRRVSTRCESGNPPLSRRWLFPSHSPPLLLQLVHHSTRRELSSLLPLSVLLHSPMRHYTLTPAPSFFLFHPGPDVDPRLGRGRRKRVVEARGLHCTRKTRSNLAFPTFLHSASTSPPRLSC